MKAYCPHCREERQVPFRNLQWPCCPKCDARLVAPPRDRQPISPASSAQREKVLGKRCVVCGREQSQRLTIDPGHLTPRRKGGCNDADCVLPMCRTRAGGGCHDAYERGQLDLLRVVAEAWPTYKAEVQHMLEHIEPVTAIEQLAGDRTQWSGLAA